MYFLMKLNCHSPWLIDNFVMFSRKLIQKRKKCDPGVSGKVKVYTIL